MKQQLLSLIGISLLQCFLQFLLKEEQERKILCLVGGAAMAALVISGLIMMPIPPRLRANVS